MRCARYAVQLSILAAVLALGAGCPPPPGEGPGAVTGVTPDGKPVWVRKGSGKYNGAHGVAFYGVGIVQGIRNPSLARQTADNRARGAIASMFHSYIAKMMKDYQRSTTAGNFRASAEEQDVVAAQKTITEVTLRGTELRDHWVDPQTGALYALAILDPNSIVRSLNDARNLPAKIRDYVRANARRAFNDLDAELAKRGGTQPQAPPAQPSDPPPAQPSAPPPAAPSAPPPPPASSGAIKVGLRITGVDRATVQTCFANRLINAGYLVYESTSDVQVQVSGELVYKRAGYNNGTQMVKAHANVRVKDLKSGQLLVAVNKRIKVGRRTVNQAVQLAVSRLCDRVVPKIVRIIRERVR